MTHSQVRNPVEVLAEEFVERFRRGERPSLAEYTEKHPDLADEIRELFPLLVEMEEVRSYDDATSPDNVPVTNPPELKQLGDYRMIREVGRGGMGIVYEAEQVSLGRHVALKVLPKELLETPQRRSRFEREAKAAAKLHHTNIVPVFGVGENEGQVYYVMQFIQGLALDEVLEELKRLKAKSGSPSRRLDAGESPECHRDVTAADAAQSLMTGTFQPLPADAGSGTGEKGGADENLAAQPGTSLPPKAATQASTATGRTSNTISISESSVILPGSVSSQSQRPPKQQTYWASIARIGVQVAEALDYAHGQGVLHRDIKPGNLLLDLRGTVWITDFGLAKLEDDGDLTQTGDILGTLRYMAPETFRGKADARSEVYSLGLTLYELLALRPAFPQTNRNTLIDQVMNAEVESLGKQNPEIPADLQTIVHKTIDRDPAHRYQTAKDLAEDLQRFVDDEPIKARRISKLEQLTRWSRRNKGLAASLSAVALLLLVINIAGPIYTWRMARLAEEAESARRESVGMLADMHTQRGFLAGEAGEAATAALWFANAATLTPHDPDRQAANRLRTRNWLNKAIIPAALLDVPYGSFQRMVFQPKGQLLLTLHTGGLRIWDWQIEQPLAWTKSLAEVTDAGWSPDGRRVGVALATGEVQIREASSGAVIRSFKHPERIETMLWSPDGKHIAVAGTRVQVWNLAAEPGLEHDWPHPDKVSALAFDRAGDRLATACQDKQARLFAVRGAPDLPAPLFPAVGHDPVYPTAPVFCDGDRKLVTLPENRGPRWWDVASGRDVTPALNVPQDGFGRRLASSSDGRWVAVAGGHSCLVWNDDGEIFTLEHDNGVHDLAFAPNGRMLMTACLDGKARVWSLPPSQRSPVSLPQMETFRRCEFSSNGRFVAIGGTREVVIWQLPEADVVVGHVRGWDDGRWRPRPSFDGRLATRGAWHESPFALGTGNNLLTVVKMANGRPAGPTISLDGRLLDSCLCADSRFVAAACVAAESGRLSVYDVRTGALVFPSVALPDLPISLAPRPGPSQVAVLCKGGQLLVIDTSDGMQILKLPHEGWSGNCPSARVEYSPDGGALITLTPQNQLFVRDAQTGQLRFPVIHPVLEGGPCRTIAVSPDSQFLATAVTGKNVVQVWDLATGKPAGPALSHPGDFYGVFAVEFSPDGRWLLSGHKDGRVRLWNWNTGKLVVPPMQHPDEVFDVKFTSDGRHVLAAVRRGTVHLWDLTTGKMAAAPVRYPLHPVHPANSTVALGVAGSRVLAGAHGHPVLNLSVLLEEPQVSVESLLALAELSTNQKLQLGELSGLEQSEWRERLATYEKVRLTPRARAESLARELDQSLDFESDQIIAHHAARFDLLERLVHLRPHVAELHLALARKYDQQADATSAEKHYKIATTLVEEQFAEQPDDPLVASRLARLVLERNQPQWVDLEAVEMESASGVSLTKQPDGSVLAGPGDFPVEHYAITGRSRLHRVAAIRLEVLPHHRLPHGGPGWSNNGNFYLTELLASCRRASGEEVPLSFRAAAADCVPSVGVNTEVEDGPWGVIDGDHATRWDVWGQLGMPHSLVVQLAEPIDLAAEDQLRIQLYSGDITHRNHRLGCFRLSVSEDDHAVDSELLRFAVNANTMSGSTELAAAHLVANRATQAVEILKTSPQHRHLGDFGVRLLLLARAQHELAQRQAARESCDEFVDWLRTNTLPRVLNPLVSNVLTEPGGLQQREVQAVLAAATIAPELARLAREIETEPASASKYLARGKYLARLGRWRESGDDFLRAVQLDPQNRYLRLWAGPVLMLAGNEQAYQQHRRDLIEQFRGTDQADIADVVCKVSLLRPGTVAPAELPLQTPRDASTDPTWARYQNWFNACCALVSYREGNPQEAIKWVQQLSERTSQAGTLALVVRAMAEYQLGQSVQARETLDLVESAIPVELRTLGTDDYNGPLPVALRTVHHDWLIPEILRREAESLLNASPKQRGL